MIARFNTFVTSEQANNGQTCHYQNFAMEAWRNDTPERPDSLASLRWPIAADYGARVPNWVYFWDGRFRNANGGIQKDPIRWAYYRPSEDSWNGNEWVLPDGTEIAPVELVTLRADNYQGVVDWLMDRNTVAAIQDMMDRSKSYFPKNGAPE